MQTYKILFDRENKEMGLFAISQVFDPATQEMFVAMANEEIDVKLSTVDEEQRIVAGAVLIPNQKILRKDPNGGEPFYIMFDADTIKEIHEAYVTNGFQNNATIEHNGELVENVPFIETWIKEDEVHDKSLMYGIDKPIGTMFAKQKINNDENWEEYIKTGKVKGFSIEGKFGLEKINLKREYMDLTAIANAIKEGFASIKLSSEAPETPAEEVTVQLAQMKLSDGVTVLEAESFEAGKEVMIINEDGSKAPAPVGEHKLEDGSVLVITQEGIIDSIKAVEVEDEMPVEMENEAKFEQLIKSIVMQMSTEVAKQIETVKVELKKEIAEAKEIQVKLSASTKAKPETQVEKTYDQMTNLEKVKFNRGLI